MKTYSHSTPPHPGRKRVKKTKSDNLANWLCDKRMDAYLGKSVVLRLAVLAQILSGKGTISGVARRFGSSKQAAAIHAAKARQVFGLPSMRG